MASALLRKLYERPRFSANEWWEARPKLKIEKGPFDRALLVLGLAICLNVICAQNFFYQTTFVNDLPLFSLSSALNREQFHPSGAFPYGGKTVPFNTSNVFTVLRQIFEEEKASFQGERDPMVSLIKPSFMIDYRQISLKLTPMRYLIDNSSFSYPGTGLVNIEFKHSFTTRPQDFSHMGPPNCNIAYDMLWSGPMNFIDHTLPSILFIKEKVEPLYMHTSQVAPMTKAAVYSSIMKYLSSFSVLFSPLCELHLAMFALWFQLVGNRVFRNVMMNWVNLVIAISNFSALILLSACSLILSMMILGTQTNNFAMFNCCMNFLQLGMIAALAHYTKRYVWETYHMFKEKELAVSNAESDNSALDSVDPIEILKQVIQSSQDGSAASYSMGADALTPTTDAPMHVDDLSDTMGSMKEIHR
ncbi:unnamed protein product [Kuraishia capsulata CBS 1993]|uniref:Uncharacterized protein n=1 Tax=Kuraishia capsulata CBS 1993 TaxID=1382522 RepID=W6MTE5_9ASCO|nr:uncharacterized protein KUCA_T00005701001 [Kuraishia capsulata CBS 1993]CDK29708.1 unnamed protein product [Kuraishia capsulata CBS 1993]